MSSALLKIAKILRRDFSELEKIQNSKQNVEHKCRTKCWTNIEQNVEPNVEEIVEQIKLQNWSELATLQLSNLIT